MTATKVRQQIPIHGDAVKLLHHVAKAENTRQNGPHEAVSALRKLTAKIQLPKTLGL